jgi:hypothetical protein
VDRGDFIKNTNRAALPMPHDLKYITNKLFCTYRFSRDTFFYNHTPTVFASDDFLMQRNFYLQLWWYSIKTTAARLTLNGHNRQPIAVRGTYFFIGLQ